MNLVPFFSIVTLAVCLTPAPCLASSVGISIVEQPVNLGTRSDPARIPLGSVGVVCNYNYGIHGKIGAARPCPTGAMRWEGGSELDQNLASVFGISVEAEDSTQISKFPVTLRVESWKPPAYSPYTKDQVLAATLWCLLRSAGGTPENPLDVRVVAEGQDDKALEAKYSGKYVNQPGENQSEAPALKVTGTVIEEDARGIAWVVFPAVARKDSFVPQRPGMIIQKADGEGDPGWHVLPVWGNGSDESEFLSLNNGSATQSYSCWRSQGVSEANAFLAEGGADNVIAVRGDKSDSVYLNHPRVNQATLAADLLALVISAQPTDARPLTISFALVEASLANYAAFRSAPGWKETWHVTPRSRVIELECQFVWDASTNKLTKGSIPLVQLEHRDWITEIPESE